MSGVRCRAAATCLSLVCLARSSFLAHLPRMQPHCLMAIIGSVREACRAGR